MREREESLLTYLDTFYLVFCWCEGEVGDILQESAAERHVSIVVLKLIDDEDFNLLNAFSESRRFLSVITTKN